LIWPGKDLDNPYRSRSGALFYAGTRSVPDPHELPGLVPSDEHAVKASGVSATGPGDDDASAGHSVDLATASFLGEVWDSYGGCFADVKLVFPARQHLPVGGA